jgi:hypothetical protein
MSRLTYVDIGRQKNHIEQFNAYLLSHCPMRGYMGYLIWFYLLFYLGSIRDTTSGHYIYLLSHCPGHSAAI